MEETQFDTEVKIICTNNGPEFFFLLNFINLSVSFTKHPVLSLNNIMVGLK